MTRAGAGTDLRYYLRRLGPGLVTGAANDDPGVQPMRALVLSQVLNGLVAIPLIVLVLRISNDPRIMGAHTNGRLANVLGWTTFGVVALVGAAAMWGIVRGG